MTGHSVIIAVLLGAVAVHTPAVKADGIPSANRKSGFDQMGPDTQAMQSDDARNPAMLAVREGESLWSAIPASGKPSCAGCHQEAPLTMKGVATRYPAFDTVTQQPIDLAGRILQCRTEKQGSPA